MIKAIATDIDGTFLTTNRQYDHTLFKKLMEKFQQKKILFIIASGDQFFFIRDLVEPFSEQLGFVAENGALTAVGSKIIDCAKLRDSDVVSVINYLDHLKDAQYIICGLQRAYIPAKFPISFRHRIENFYTKLATINHFSEINDRIFKFAIQVPVNRTKTIANQIDKKFTGTIRATVSGNGAIDLIIPGMDKSHGLKLLLKHYDISPKELAVFGDGYNDLEMFDLAGFSYAMGNSANEVKKAANKVIGTNDEQAELKELARMFL